MLEESTSAMDEAQTLLKCITQISLLLDIFGQLTKDTLRLKYNIFLGYV